MVLRTDVALRGKGPTTVGEFTVAAGTVTSFTLTYAPSQSSAARSKGSCGSTARDRKFLERMVCPRANRTGGAPRRGHALTDRAQGVDVRADRRNRCGTHDEPSGNPGRDPQLGLQLLLAAGCHALALLSLMNAGYYDEAGAWRDWLLRAVAGSPDQAQIMYSVTGERRLTEWLIDWLPGYEGAQPVRVGNGAHGQIQIDVYGEVMDALYQAHRGGLASSADAWALQKALLGSSREIWRSPDRGIWESRGPERHFTFSKVMAWVAFDRGTKLASDFGDEELASQWRGIADVIHADVCSKGYDPELGSFVQSYGSKWLDGSLLLIPTTGFLPIEDPRIAGTVRAIEGRLLADGLVMRHDPAEVETGLAHGEGAFLACSFWLADAYALLGRQAEGEQLFSRLLALRNDVGLLSEEYDPTSKRLIGNFPQAFSHVALINTAQNLTRLQKPGDQRAGNALPGS